MICISFCYFLWRPIPTPNTFRSSPSPTRRYCQYFSYQPFFYFSSIINMELNLPLQNNKNLYLHLFLFSYNLFTMKLLKSYLDSLLSIFLLPFSLGSKFVSPPLHGNSPYQITTDFQVAKFNGQGPALFWVHQSVACDKVDYSLFLEGIKGRELWTQGSRTGPFLWISSSSLETPIHLPQWLFFLSPRF